MFMFTVAPCKFDCVRKWWKGVVGVGVYVMVGACGVMVGVHVVMGVVGVGVYVMVGV